MKTEYEILKEICDKINYLVDAHYSKERGFYWEYGCEYCNDKCIIETLDVREIIFTPEFMDKILDYLYIENPTNNLKLGDIFFHLRNPVEYLANLLNINKE